MDSIHVTFVEHLSTSPRPLCPGVTVDSLPPSSGEDTLPPTTADPTIATAPHAHSVPTEKSPPPPETTVVHELRRSTQERVSMPSREESNDGLNHGRTMVRVLEEIHG